VTSNASKKTEHDGIDAIFTFVIYSGNV